MFKLNKLFARQRARNRITLRILVPLVLAMAVVLASFAFAVWRMQQKTQAGAADLSAQEVARLLHAEEDHKSAVLKTTIQALMNDEQLAESFRRRDRADLLERAMPLFDSLRREHGITHFYFHLPDHTVLLRMHDPAAHGDRIERHTMLEAEGTGNVAIGMERGLTGIFTLRAVSPWRQNGRLLGYLELGVEFESIIQEIHNDLDKDVEFVVAVNKQFLDRKQWADAAKRAGRPAEWSRFPRLVVISKTMETLPELAAHYLSSQNKALASSREGAFQAVDLPLTDVSGVAIGELIVLRNVASQMAVARQSIQFIMVLSVVVCGAVLVFFYFLISGVEGDLADRTTKLRKKIDERVRAEESLRLLNSAVLQSKEAILITDAELDWPAPHIVFVNPAFTMMTGYSAEDAIGKTPRILQGPRTDKAVLKRLRQNLERGEMFEGQAINYRKDGTEFDLEWHVAPIRLASGEITHFVSIQRDITARKRLEARLFQSQNMETVGKLAGGVAHEFNSIVTAIIGQSELLRNDLPAGSPLGRNVAEIGKAAVRAAALTRQLLAYGRKQMLRADTVNVNNVLTNMEGMLRHVMGSDVNLRLVSGDGLQTVNADAGQIEQVIMNIAVNAREAMPNGGALTLETTNVSVDPESVGRDPELKPGDYVMLAITDTGTGMSAEVKGRLFEPFFTTKGVGQGTGLGLSTCYGIIKQSGGHISVYSEPARGATFKIYLPMVEQQTIIPPQRLDSPDLPRGTESILLVEDDPALREMAASLLRRLGYTVLAAANGIEALNLKHQRDGGNIDVLFTDVVMPHMSGKELSERVRASYPHTRILFTSAYTENGIVHQGVLDKGVAFLQKPFTPSALAHKLREVLDEPSAANGDRARQA